MKKFAALAFAVAFAALFGSAAHAADHRDGPLATGDPAADLNDVYLFVNPNDATETILIGTYFPDAPKGARFSDAVDYRFFINNGAATNGNIEIRCRFSDGGISFSCAGVGGNTLAASGRFEQTVNATDFRVYVGLRDDPFFFDAPQFNAIRLGQAPGFRNPGVNSFGTFNTLSIVMGIRSSRLTNNGANPVLRVWGSTDRTGGSGISSGHTGLWYDPSNSGHGVVLQTLPAGALGTGSPRSMMAYWNVFDNTGAQLAVYGTGPINNRSVSVPVVSGTGGAFPPATVRGPNFAEPAFGTLNFTFSSCTNATMAVTATRPGFASPTINLTRLSSIDGVPCTFFDSGQIDRNGRAAINTALMGSVRDNPALKDAYNRASNPAMWDSMFRAEFEFSMGGLDGLDGIQGNGVTGLSRPALAGVLLDDRLIMDTRIPACGQYLAVELGLATACGGRTLAADVIDVSLAGLVGPGVSDNVALDSTLLTNFPFMNVPQ
jgi:hypothetical protein